jgi:hypothetical protein
MIPDPSARQARRVTLRSILIGLALAVFISLWIPYNIWMIKASGMDFEHISLGLMIPFLFIVIVLNGGLRRFGPAAPLNTPELIVVLSMGLVASTIPSSAFMGYFIATISTPYYFASPENQWADVFFRHLPPWLLADASDHAMQWFYEGIPAGRPIPWNAWTVALFWWGLFFVVLFFVGSCLMVILRKQWMEHEKLAFPLAQVLLQIVEQPENRTFLPPFMRPRLFWVGFFVPLVIVGWNIINYFTPIGLIPIGQPYATTLIIGRVFPGVLIKVNLWLFCFAFFSPVDILLSIWLFHLFAVLEAGGMNAIGLVETGASPEAAVQAQEIGGLIVFVLWGFWMARRHLRDVVRKAFGSAPDVDDTGEFFSYRAAVFGVVFGIAYMVCWLHVAGMHFGIMIPFLLLLFIFYIGVARIVAEAGIAALDLPLNSHEFLVRAVGSSRIDPASLTVFGLANTFARNWKTFTMVSVSHITRIGDRVWSNKRRMFALICVTFAIALVVGAVFTIYSGYATVGAYHFGQFAFGTGNIAFFENVKIWINNPTRLSTLEAVWFGLGGVVMMLLIALRYQFPGWPLHPIGFTIARGVAIDNAFFTTFLAWLIKTILLRIGGIGLYQRAQPLFLGMLVGFAAGVLLSTLVDMVWFPGQGHVIHGW